MPNVTDKYVYHVPYKGLTLYIKFTQGTITDFALLSFKEK